MAEDGARTGTVGRRTWLLAAASAAAIAFLVGLFWSRQKDDGGGPRRLPAATVQSVQGLAHAGQERRELTPGAAIPIGETVETGTGASLGLALKTGGTVLALAANTSLTLAAQAEVRLTRGGVDVETPSAFLEVTTPSGRVLARQSKVWIAIVPEGTDVEVMQGDALLLLPDGRRQTVTPGAKVTLPAPRQGG